MKNAVNLLWKWVVLIFTMPIYAIFISIATVCNYIANKIEDFSILLCHGVDGYKQHKMYRELE